jgi:Protein of unknown function (DUF3253)
MPHSRIRPPIPEETLSQLIHACVLEVLSKHLGEENGVCPSEVAMMAAEDLPIDWRDLMRPVRMVAAHLAEQGRLDILQNGKVVNIREVRGDVRLRLRRKRYASDKA